MNKKIYIVQVGCYSDEHIIGVFDDEKVAKDFVVSTCTNDSWNDPHIEEFELNELSKPHGLLPFDVTKTYFSNGDIYEKVSFDTYSLNKEITPLNLYVKDFKQDTYVNKPERKILRRFSGTIFAKSQEHAKKTFGDYCLAYNSNQPLPEIKEIIK